MLAKRVYPATTDRMLTAIGGEQDWTLAYRVDRSPPLRDLLTNFGAFFGVALLTLYNLTTTWTLRRQLKGTSLLESFDHSRAACGWCGPTWFSFGLVCLASLPAIILLVMALRNAAQWTAEYTAGPRIARGLVRENVGGWGLTQDSPAARLLVGETRIAMTDAGRLKVPMGYEAIVEYSPLGRQALLIYVRKP